MKENEFNAFELQFDKLGFFGNEDDCKVVYMSIKEDSKAFDFLLDLSGLLIDELLVEKVIYSSELSHIYFNKVKKIH